MHRSLSPSQSVRTAPICLAGVLFALSFVLAVPGLWSQFTAQGQAQMLQSAGAMGVAGSYLQVNLRLYGIIRTLSALCVLLWALCLWRTLLPCLLHPDDVPDGAGFSWLSGLCRGSQRVWRFFPPVLAVLFAVLCTVRGAEYLRRSDVMGAFSMLLTELFMAALLAGVLLWAKRFCSDLEDALALARYALVTDRADPVGITGFVTGSFWALGGICVLLCVLRSYDPVGAASYGCAAAANVLMGIWLEQFRRINAALAREKAGKSRKVS